MIFDKHRANFCCGEEWAADSTANFSYLNLRKIGFDFDLLDNHFVAVGMTMFSKEDIVFP